MTMIKEEYLIKISVESNNLDDKRFPIVKEIVKTEDNLDDVSDVWDVINAAKEAFVRQNRQV